MSILHTARTMAGGSVYMTIQNINVGVREVSCDAYRSAPAVAYATSNCRLFLGIYAGSKSRRFLSQPSLTKQRYGHTKFVSDASSAGGSSWMDMPESQPLPEEPLQIFPRIREKDPYKLLGISREASFEEIQDARNYLYEQYKQHEPSRESIELAFDSILQTSIKFRHKFGFKPPKTGRRTDASGDPEKISIIGKVKEAFEPSVPSVTIVNDGSIFLALALWASWQAGSSDPTLPLGAALCFCAWKLYDKRNKRNPDGPYWGNSPIWGALLSTVLSLIAGGLLSYVLAQILPLPPKISIDAMGLFVITMSLGFTCLFLK